MTAFIDADGSALVGGLNQAGVGQALKLDAAGNLKTTSGASAATDGQSGADVPANAVLAYNGGAPAGSFDRLRSLQGKGPAVFHTITSGAEVGSTHIVFADLPAGLGPGQQLILAGGGGAESLYTALSYVAGTNPVPVQSPITGLGRTGAYWDYNTALGPGLSGFLPIGVIPTATTIYEPDTGDYFLVRAANADAMEGKNVPVFNPAVFNGTHFDRMLGLNGAGVTTDLVRYYTSVGKAYTANVGLLTSATGTNVYPLALFNPAGSGKMLLIYSLQGASDSSSVVFMRYTTLDPAYATAATVTNNMPGAAVSTISATCTTTSQTLAGPYALVAPAPFGTAELLTDHNTLLLSPGHGLTLFLQTTTAGSNSLMARWLEY